MMIGILITFAILGCMLLAAGCIWQMKLLMRKVAKLERQQLFLQQNQFDPEDPSVQVLSQQVDQLHQAMGGVMQGLQTMSRQVYTLNQLAGSAMQQAMQSEHPLQLAPSQMMIQPGQQEEAQHFEDLPEAMQEKVRAFQALHIALMHDGNFPSRKRPDLN